MYRVISQITNNAYCSFCLEVYRGLCYGASSIFSKGGVCVFPKRIRISILYLHIYVHGYIYAFVYACLHECVYVDICESTYAHVYVHFVCVCIV